MSMGKLVGYGLALGMMFSVNVSLAADTNKGAQLYQMHCAVCHGVNGIAVMPGAANFTSTDKSMMRPDAFILNTIKEGRNAMPAFQGVLQDKDILDVISHMRTLN